MTTSSARWRGFWLVVVGLALIGAMFHEEIIGRVTYAVEKAKLEAGQEELAKVQAISEAFRLIAKQVKPGVVQISSTIVAGESSSKRRRLEPEDLPEPWRDFFGDRLPFDLPTPHERQGSGSGVIIDAANGYILTNNHVVGDAKGEQSRLDVKLADGRPLEAKVVGRDPKTDLALIQIKADRLHELPLGDSQSMEVGDWVLAIGAPFGLEQTVTQGIISAKGRNVGIVGIENFLQTDAAINPGNSGGPLVNMRGEVIGINTAIATSGLAQGYMGVGFAVPTEMVKEVLPYLKEGKPVVRGYLGVSIRGLDTFAPGIGKTFGLPDDSGVLIEDFYPTSDGQETPAAKGGLKPDDIILKYDGKKVATAPELIGLVAHTKPGTTVDLVIWRDKKEITIPVKIEEQPDDFYAHKARGHGRYRGEGDESGNEATIEALGMTVRPLTPALAKKYGWDPDENKGMLVVTELEALGEARASGIGPGDLIAGVQGKRVATVRELKEVLSDRALAQGVRIKIRNAQYGPRTVYIRISP